MEHPLSIDIATLGGGCFWCLEAALGQLAGVTSIVSGYAGGATDHPSYAQVSTGTTGHAEVVRIEFESAIIDYRSLLGAFFAIHDPTTLDRQGHDIGSQYRSVIFTHETVQADTARALIAELDAAQYWPSRIVTAVLPASTFWPAEAHHQNYYARYPSQGYCQAVVVPKMAKLRRQFAGLLKAG
jgi:peptide-methionine (S)-S-oxide reductase